MHRLYILGALALAGVQAYISAGPSTAAVDTSLTYGKFTYTATADCYTTATATPLGMNNIYYQYYTFALAKGTVTQSTLAARYTGESPVVQYADNAITGCTHSHLYNWMAQPSLGSTGAWDGTSDAVVAYGYVMGGTTLATCALTNPIVTTAIYASNVFSGARFQSVSGIITPAYDIGQTESTVTSYLLVQPSYYGQGALYTAQVTARAFAASLTLISPDPSTPGIVLTSAQNLYYDFAQTQVFQGQTQFGRGGGATTAPCGWWVVYANEGAISTSQAGTEASTWNVAASASWASVSVHMWTDNAMTNTIAAFVLAALGAALY